MKHNRVKSGQILLITLLVLSVALTIALSLIARSSIDTSLSTQVEESNRAFSAAEAGIEDALKSGVGGTKALSASNTSYIVTAETIGGTTSYDAGQITLGESSTIWFIPHLNTGEPDYGSVNYYQPTKNITICWSGQSPASAETPALEGTVYYLSSGTYKTSKFAFDPFSDRRSINRFIDPDNVNQCDVGAANYTASFRLTDYQVGVADKPIFMRLRPVYAETSIALKTETDLPGLGTTFTSCGSSTPGVTACISARQLYPEPPDVFDYVLYANNGSVQ